MLVSEAVGRALVGAGVNHAFGVVGSGNFHVTNAMVAAGARFVAARHEGGAATMADAYSRNSGTPTALTVHQGCGLTNAMTGIAEAAKSRTPLVVLAPEATSPQSNFFVDQDALARAVGAVPVRITNPATAVQQAVDAVACAVHQRRTVVINLPLEILGAQAPDGPVSHLPPAPESLLPVADDLTRLVAALRSAQRPVFVAGRGARSTAARDALIELADATGALLATSAVAKGLFHDHAWTLDVSGGFSSPLAAELIGNADLIVGWGCALNAHAELSFGVAGDVAATAAAALAHLVARQASGYRSEQVGHGLATSLAWRDVPFVDCSGEGRIDPRALTIALDDMLPSERVVSVDSGTFMGYPSMFLSVPDEQGFCFTQAFQSIGLGLATAIGAALSRPDRLPVAALGDGGALMGAAELDTVRRLGLPMVVIIYNDDAYGAEVHHFSSGDHPMDTVTFPDSVRSIADLEPVRGWLAGPRDTPLLIDAKVVGDEPSWWLEEAFRGH